MSEAKYLRVKGEFVLYEDGSISLSGPGYLLAQLGKDSKCLEAITGGDVSVPINTKSLFEMVKYRIDGRAKVGRA